MNDKCRTWLIVVTGVVVLASTIAWAVAWRSAVITAAAFENGYSEKVIPGTKNTYWSKE